MIIVADTGPLLHLHWVDASSWALPPLPIEVVDTVWQEVASYAPEALDDARLRRVASPVDRPPEIVALVLDDGEAALPVVGSIGLVVEAHRAGRASKALATSTLSELPGRGRLHVSPAIVRSAIDALG